jgi:hypothetical protein
MPKKIETLHIPPQDDTEREYVNVNIDREALCLVLIPDPEGETFNTITFHGGGFDMGKSDSHFALYMMVLGINSLITDENDTLMKIGGEVMNEMQETAQKEVKETVQ